ncbi:hypothetical protein QTG54_013483 [Skeletonema marinoi]|uniref:Uncharacterized protein n=1 Tax=Skeletonema marinoi TaxID=267567 RepID=A0AAD9D6K1_9STRA|nr:hypothetical protein QTG54_013483 [Skeletonema marinoi]
MATEGSSKRRRVAVNVSSSGVKILYDLPIEPLVYVANFLSMSSRAMFALALADDGSFTESNSRQIVGDECETLDFGDEKELAAKLSDGDIDAILRRVDAVNKLKILRLTNCINITGVGLESLRGSDIIEKIDLSLVGEHEDQSLLPEPPISCEHVLPILDTIINVEGGALKYLHFPRHWRLNESTGSDFHHFLDRFNQMLCVRGLNRCLKCNGERELTVELGFSLDDYGIQFSTCYACSKHYCEDCSVIHDDCNMNLCLKCGRVYCSDCSVANACGSCATSFCAQCIAPAQCSGCEEILCDTCRCHCQNCQRSYCDDCHAENECDVCRSIGCGECLASYRECEDCYFGHCADCVEEAGINRMHSCEDCGRQQCIHCRLRRPYPIESSCSGCFKIISEPWISR